MSKKILAFDAAQWALNGLADFGDFADRIVEVNVGEDAFSGYGEWFFIPDETLPNANRVIYFGSWGNDHCLGSSMHTHAEIFDGGDPDELAEFTHRALHWDNQPEFTDDPAEFD